MKSYAWAVLAGKASVVDNRGHFVDMFRERVENLRDTVNGLRHRLHFEECRAEILPGSHRGRMVDVMQRASLRQTLTDLVSSARFTVRGDSMLPALADGESVLAASTRQPGYELHRGDIVVFRNPVLKERIFVKRIVGLPNEGLRLDGGLVYIDGEALKEPYLAGEPTESLDAHREWWMGPGEYFVMGDNRGDSEDDSRAFGPVDRGLVLGRVWFRCWPLRAWGRVPRSGYFDG